MLQNDYYLINFRTLVQFVARLYDDMLLTGERRWLDAIESLAEPAARLYVRLVCRRGPVFRLSKLRYREIADIEAAANELVMAGLAHRDAPTTLVELLPLFSKRELLPLSERADLGARTRAHIDCELLKSTDKTLCDRLRAADRWLTIRGQDCLACFMLCYFGNARQNLSDFVLRELGTLRFAPYRLDSASRAFPSRAALDAHWQLHLAEQACNGIDCRDIQALTELADTLPARDTHDAVLCRRIDRLINRIARQLERLAEPHAALALYRRAERPPARERQVRLLHATGDTRQALTLCQRIRRAPTDEQELCFAESMEPKLRHALGERLSAPRRFRPYTTKLTLRHGGGRVESVSAGYFSRFGECYVVENRLITGVLGLFIWDIVFAPVAGAFFNPFQTGPADFYEPDFCRMRAPQLEQRLAELGSEGQWQARVCENFSRHHGLLNPLVNWSALSLGLLQRALERIPAVHWRALFERLLADPRHNGNGLPDLVLFAAGGGYEFIEIKGPGDTLQPNQWRWMRYFDSHGIPCRVVQIRWVPSLVRDQQRVPGAEVAAGE